MESELEEVHLVDNLKGYATTGNQIHRNNDPDLIVDSLTKEEEEDCIKYNLIQKNSFAAPQVPKAFSRCVIL